MLGRHRDGLLAFVLDVVRLRRLFESTRRVVDQVEDGHETYDGQYIFDRHYVAALVEGVTDALNQVVYHGALLAPERAAVYFERFDRVRRQARALIGRSPAPDVGQRIGERDDSLFSSPEFRLLSSALAWMEGDGDAPLALMFEVSDGAVARVRKALGSCKGQVSWDVARSGARHTISVVDIDGMGAADTDAQRLLADCPPFQVLVGEGGAGPNTGGGGGDVDWLAGLAGDHLSLFGKTRGVDVFVEAALGGHAPSDFVLLHTAGGRLEVPSGLKAHETPAGSIHWLYGVGREHLEQALHGVGETLFG